MQVLCVSPLIRPDAEEQPNRLGASLRDLRREFEGVVSERIEAGDATLRLLAGEGIIAAEHLADGIHPSDAGHERVAEAIEPVLGAMISRTMARSPS